VRTPRLGFALMTTVVLYSGCASGGTNTDTGGSRDVLTREQLLATQEDNALDAVRRLRSQWLRARGPARSAGLPPVQVAVFINDVRRGGVDVLADIRIEEVAEIRFISATDATTRWGPNVAGGVIAVTVSN